MLLGFEGSNETVNFCKLMFFTEVVTSKLFLFCFKLVLYIKALVLF